MGYIKGNLFLVITIAVTMILQPSLEQELLNPCRLAKARRHPKSIPFIRILDDERPDIILGGGGLPFYSIPPSSTTLTPIVIECSSVSGPVRWTYSGRGASSGVKVVSTVWTGGRYHKNRPRPNCYSSGLVISNVTDQLTGEYSCSTEQERDSFVLFVPHAAPFHYPEGDVAKLTLTSVKEPIIVLPCISKRRSGAGIGLYREVIVQQDVDEGAENVTKLERMDLGPGLRYDPFAGFLLKPTKGLLQVGGGSVNFTCKFEGDLKNFGELKNRTLLRVQVHLTPEEKVAPDKSSVVSAFSPYFSWTSLTQPVVQLEQLKGSVQPTEWQQIYTKNDFEEGNSSAAIFHLGSYHLVDGDTGSEGRVTLRQKGNEQKVLHAWDYKIFDKEKEPFVGLSYSHDPQDYHHVFTCVSATDSIPNITFKPLVSDEVGLQTNEGQDLGYIITECHDHPDPSLGCLILTSTIPMGEVTCIGEGVESTVRYPLGFAEASRPFFLERGQTLQITVDEKDIVVTLPCLTNTPESQAYVHLFWKRDGASEWEMLWSPPPPGDDVGVDVDKNATTGGIEFHPNWGFHLNTSFPRWSGNGSSSVSPSGEYLCSSSGDVEDKSDAVMVTVTKRGWSVSPKEIEIVGGLPYSFRWAWSAGHEPIVAEGDSLKEHVKVKPAWTHQKWNKAELVMTPELFQHLNDGSDNNGTPLFVLNITLIQGGVQIHQWKFFRIASTKVLGLNVTTSWGMLNKGNADTDSKIEMTCQGSPTTLERDRARLSFYVCQNNATCDFINKCLEKDCNSDHNGNLIDDKDGKNCFAKDGCARQVLKSLPLNGYLKAVCKYNGITETRTIADFFFREDMHMELSSNTGDDSLDHEAFLSSNAATTEQNPSREIWDLGSNLGWEVGDSVTFTCGANPTRFSQGIRWALQDAEGSLHFQPEDPYDPQWKYSTQTQLLSTFTLHITNFGVKRVFCFVPYFSLTPTVYWKNMSQPVFLRGEIEENCHDNEPSIRLISVYPPPSRLANFKSFSSSDHLAIQLDKVGSFLATEGLLQFGVRITAPDPVEWSFEGAPGSGGPSSTPLVQSDRAIGNYYDPSSYCYTSKLLVNLRKKDSEKDTGSYVAKFGDKSLRFHLFVPNNKPPYLINSGKHINLTMEDFPGDTWTIPCPVNNPYVDVQLLKLNAELMDGVVSNISYSEVKPRPKYDPKKGFSLPKQNAAYESLSNWKCVVINNGIGHPEDSVEVHIVPEKKNGELKYELVGDIHVFTCSSENGSTPELNLDPIPSLRDEAFDTDHELAFVRKDCFGGCAIIMTTVAHGKVTCLGRGVNATYILGQNHPKEDVKVKANENSLTKVEVEVSTPQVKTGIWYDPETKAFKCREVNANSVNDSSLSVFPNLVGVTCRRPNECRMMQQRLLGDGDHSQSTTGHCGAGCTQLKVDERVKPSWAPNWFSIFLRCNDMFAQFFQDNGVTSLATKESVHTFKTIRLDVTSFTRDARGMFSAKLRCFANRYFYSRGIVWGLEKGDGTIQFQENSAASEVEIQSFNSVMSEIRLEFDEQQLRRVWCFVPLLGSAKWANSSLTTPITELIHNIASFDIK